MERKTCGDCIFYHGIRDDAGICALTDEFEQTCDFVYSCKSFSPAPPITNGDKIRTMCNDVLLQYVCLLPCEICPAKKIKGCNKDTWDGTTKCQQNWLDYLNAPAESEVENE